MGAALLEAARWLAAAVEKTDRFVRGAALKALVALREGRLPPSPAWWLRALRLHWRELDGGWHQTPEPARWDREALEASYRRWRAARRPPASAGALAVEGPLISVVAWARDAGRLRELLETLRTQPYGRWELCAESCLRATLARATGEFVAFLDPDDRLAPEGLLHVAGRLVREPDLDWLYTDADRVGADGCHGEPDLKGAFSPELALAHAFATRLAVVRRARIQEAGGLGDGAPAAAILDLLLRLWEGGARVGHVAEVCCHRGAMAAADAAADVERAVEAALRRRGLRARPVTPPVLARLGLPVRQLRWDPGLLAERPVTIVVPTRDRVDLLDTCVASLERTLDARHVRLLVVDDDSTEPATRRYLGGLERRGVLACRVVRAARPRSLFDYARVMNLAAREVETPLMLQLNDDVEATAPGWLEQMAGWFAVPEVGVVGAKLVYPNGALQHAGVALRARDGLPLHLCHGLDAEEAGYQLLPHLARNVAAVTGACLLTPTALFHELGGFDGARFRVQHNDIDYCLRVLDTGRRVVYEPAAVLVHRGSASRGAAYDYRENLAFRRRHGTRADPYLSPHLDPGSLCGPSPRLRAP